MYIVDNYVIELLKAGNTESVIKLQQNGYSLPDSVTQADGLPEEATQLLTRAADFPVSDYSTGQCALLCVKMSESVVAL